MVPATEISYPWAARLSLLLAIICAEFVGADVDASQDGCQQARVAAAASRGLIDDETFLLQKVAQLHRSGRRKKKQGANNEQAWPLSVVVSTPSKRTTAEDIEAKFADEWADSKDSAATLADSLAASAAAGVKASVSSPLGQYPQQQQQRLSPETSAAAASLVLSAARAAGAVQGAAAPAVAAHESAAEASFRQAAGVLADMPPRPRTERPKVEPVVLASDISEDSVLLRRVNASGEASKSMRNIVDGGAEHDLSSQWREAAGQAPQWHYKGAEPVPSDAGVDTASMTPVMRQRLSAAREKAQMSQMRAETAMRALADADARAKQAEQSASEAEKRKDTADAILADLEGRARQASAAASDAQIKKRRRRAREGICRAREGTSSRKSVSGGCVSKDGSRSFGSCDSTARC
eukprot:gnl/TRDRNA2_/TRDRNA2_73816_c0_seq1.p1 gnl/TRDRNA2_/TRDRNA2_73816_c0~~gnl/TRDRNA2_/TRDRNA2_73816_c0_seq1.p1  ORF type:complete len:409 (-),score=77.25 gnl/TRDRNA2_/TRDRNA2_73816_c0_seq1:619-1845(-)